MNKDFDSWNKIKKNIESKKLSLKFPEEKEVWVCNLGKNIGYEQNGTGDNFSRPILIIKKFNNKMFWAIPLSSKQKDFDFYFNFTDPNNNKVSIIIAQMKLVNIKRIERKIYRISEKDFFIIREKIKSFL